MESKTRDHLSLAARNQEFVRWLADQSESAPPGARAWIVVAAFYSAVHYINGYLWEVEQIEPASHHRRSARVQHDATLQTVFGEYQLLRDWAYFARYDPTFGVTPAHCEQAGTLLAQIASVVTDAIED